jgi:hypothetical protein
MRKTDHLYIESELQTSVFQFFSCARFGNFARKSSEVNQKVGLTQLTMQANAH